MIRKAASILAPLVFGLLLFPQLVRLSCALIEVPFSDEAKGFVIAIGMVLGGVASIGMLIDRLIDGGLS